MCHMGKKIPRQPICHVISYWVSAQILKKKIMYWPSLLRIMAKVNIISPVTLSETQSASHVSMSRCRHLPFPHRLQHNASIQDGTSIVRLHGYADLVSSHVLGLVRGRARVRTERTQMGTVWLVDRDVLEMFLSHVHNFFLLEI